MKSSKSIKRLGLGTIVLATTACAPANHPNDGSDAGTSDVADGGVDAADGGAPSATDGGSDAADVPQGDRSLIGTWRAVLPDPSTPGSGVESYSAEIRFDADRTATTTWELRYRADSTYLAGCVVTDLAAGGAWSTTSSAAGATLTIGQPAQQTEAVAGCVAPSDDRPATPQPPTYSQPIEDAPYTLMGDTLTLTVAANGRSATLTFLRE